VISVGATGWTPLARRLASRGGSVNLAWIDTSEKFACGRFLVGWDKHTNAG
jgi:hypothetical protein